MSNNNIYWGKRFGSLHKDGTNQFTVKQMTSGKEGQGPHQTPLDPRSPIGLEAERQRQEAAARGRPTMTVSWRNRRMNVTFVA